MIEWIKRKGSSLLGGKQDNNKEGSEEDDSKVKEDDSKVKEKDGAVMDRIPLSRLIGLVTDELRKAESLANQREDHVMQFEECELEMAVEVETGGTAEANVYVFTLGGERTRTNSNTITVKFGKLEGKPPMAFPGAGEGKGPELGRRKNNGGEENE